MFLSRITFENIEQPADADSAVSPVSLHGSEAGTEASTKEEAVHKTPVETEEEKGGCAKLDNGIVGEGESSSHYRHKRTFHLRVNLAFFKVCFLMRACEMSRFKSLKKRIK